MYENSKREKYNFESCFNKNQMHKDHWSEGCPIKSAIKMLCKVGNSTTSHFQPLGRDNFLTDHAKFHQAKERGGGGGGGEERKEKSRKTRNH